MCRADQIVEYWYRVLLRIGSDWPQTTGLWLSFFRAWPDRSVLVPAKVTIMIPMLGLGQSVGNSTDDDYCFALKVEEEELFT